MCLLNEFQRLFFISHYFFFKLCSIWFLEDSVLVVSGCQAMHQRLKIKAKSGNPGWEPQKLAKKGCDAKIRAQFTATTGSYPSGKGRSRLAGYKPVRTLLMLFFRVVLHVHFLDHHCSFGRKDCPPPLGCRSLMVHVVGNHTA